MDINSMLSNGSASPTTAPAPATTVTTVTAPATVPAPLDDTQRRTSVASLLNSDTTAPKPLPPVYSRRGGGNEESEVDEVSDEDNSEEEVESRIDSRSSGGQNRVHTKNEDEDEDEDDELERELENLDEEFEEKEQQQQQQPQQQQQQQQQPEVVVSEPLKQPPSQQHPPSGRKSPLPSASVLPKKPRVYSVPPIWSMKWNPYKRLLDQGASPEQARSRYLSIGTPNHKPRSQNDTFGSTQSLSSHNTDISEIIPATKDNATSLVSLTGFAPCISGFKPFEEITRLVATWLLGNLQRMTDEERENMELEIKLGVLYNKITKERINLNIASEAIVDRNYKADHLYFEPGLNEEQFEGLKTVLSSLKSLRKEVTLYRDTGYQNLRITEDHLTNRVVERVSKVRVSDLVVTSPGDLLDYRISLSTEIPVLDNVEPKGRLHSIRIKNRESYISPGIRIDVTEVTTASQGNHLTHEVELESDGKILLNYFNGLGDPTTNSGDKFEEMVQILIDNTRFINRKISRNY